MGIHYTLYNIVYVLYITCIIYLYVPYYYYYVSWYPDSLDHRPQSTCYTYYIAFYLIQNRQICSMFTLFAIQYALGHACSGVIRNLVWGWGIIRFSKIVHLIQ